MVTPLTGSIVNVPFVRGQARMALEVGMATKRQLAEFDGVGSGITGVFGGYLYSNVSLARSAVARTPGLTVEMVDRQMFGLTDATPWQRGPGDRSPVAGARSTWRIARVLLRPSTRQLDENRRDIAAYVASAPCIARATDDELIAMGPALAPRLERMMHDLIVASAGAAVGRTMLERLVATSGDDALVNRLSGGLGTVESAEPAVDLWPLGRMVAADRRLTAMFDDGVDGLDTRLRQAAPYHHEVAVFVAGFDEFRSRHGARGPDEWELASPTWGSEPAIALALVDRLRHAPEDRDPQVVGRRLAAERLDAVDASRRTLPRTRRPMLDLAVRTVAFYGPQREATKAAFVRMLDPLRRALAELARRSGIPHHDFFLLTVDQLPAAMTDPTAFGEVIAERRRRRDYLQARVPPFWFDGVLPSPETWELRADRRRPDTGGRVINGLGVCAGVVTGTARVVSDPTQPGELQPGDILVAPITDPAWTPLFLAAAGVVVDVGAQQSHAAIVARELGIPAVVSADGASTTIVDGALVTVDGGAGTVTVHPAGAAADAAAV